MKSIKIILTITLLIVVSAAHSQIRIGAKGGVNVAYAKFSKDVFDAENLTGFNIGPVIEFMLGGLGFDAAVLYTQKGFKSKEETVKDSYLQIPVNLKYKFGLTSIKPYIAAGPYIDLKIAGDNVWEIPSNVAGAKEQIKSKDFGAGLNFGAGIEVAKMIQLGVNWSWGLTNNYSSFDVKESESYKGKSVIWSGSVIVLF
jgi:opacity protein-like surface antigen